MPIPFIAEIITKEFWKDCATISKGECFNIDSDKAVVHIVKLYDDAINHTNDSLNKTYDAYESLEGSKKSNQLMLDSNAGAPSESSKTERARVKSKVAYTNTSWDIMNAVDKRAKDITTMKE